MIVTVTCNPSLDRTLAVAALVRGEVIRAESTMEDPGGKGVNVTRFLVARGNASVAVLPSGGAIGRALVGALSDAGIPHRAVPIAGATRSNVTVVEPDGTTTKLNEPGPALSGAEVDALVAAVAERAMPGGWVVVAGSLPADLDTSIVARLGEVARAAGARFALDASGAALADGLAAGPDLIKPNAEELGEVLGRPLATLDEVLAGCDEARARGAGAVICSLGAEGAVLVDGAGRWHGRGPAVPVVSTVGAGDSVLAGFLHGGGAGPDALRTGIAWATAAVQTPGTGVPDAALIDPAAVQVAELPRGTPSPPAEVAPTPA
ncbi:MAG: 1-phosphofructokinase [Candidatus Nanopelagicales bacterium]|jgi:1-phosphofructokinase|nr:1-phosphofructokinase [Candidatus Nanopelagicales bacterium]